MYEIMALCLLYVIIINYNMMAEGWMASKLDLSGKVHILVKMVEFSTRTERCRLHNSRNCSTLVQLYSQDFWTQSSRSFSPRKTVRKKTKTKPSLEKHSGVLTFEVFVFEVLVFEFLDLRS